MAKNSNAAAVASNAAATDASAEAQGGGAQLTDDMDVKQAMMLVMSGIVSMEEYLKWDAARVERARAAAGGNRSSGPRITVSEKGLIVLNGVRQKGEGFALWFLPHEVADLCDQIAALADAVVSNADRIVSPEATVKDQRDGWKQGEENRFVERPHVRRGKAALAWEGITSKGKNSRDPGSKASVVERCKAFLAKLRGEAGGQ